jgi:predicted DNA-binding antitoxin AbrB/MazE fold protein
MTVSVKARYANGVFTPLEPVDLEEGTEVIVSMDGTPPRVADAAEGRGSLAHLIEELHASPLAREPGTRPADLAEHYKHYLYGHPKDEAL